MKKLSRMLCALLLAACMCACSATAEELTGEAEGYGGPLKVAVTVTDGKISQVKVTSHQETEGVGTRAIDELPAAIVAAGGTDVDVVAGATYTSRAILQAVDNAMGRTSASPAAQPEATSAAQDTLRHGLGMSAVGRLGPGTDSEGNQVYSFNVAFCSASFDKEGRVVHSLFDVMEVVTPNCEGTNLPQFSGFPGQGGFAKWDDAQGKVSGRTEDTEESYLAEFATWTTKRRQGDSYKLGKGSWAEEMDAFQRFFEGKTVDEIEAWYAKACSDVNGRPLTAESTQSGDADKYAALTDEEKQSLVDLTTSATMSLRDPHGDLLTALRMAWEQAK